MTDLIHKKTFNITTFGCQMNEHDSEIMAGMLIEKGYEHTADRSKADIVIFNTCSIRENADKRFFGTLGQLKHRNGGRRRCIHRMRVRLHDAAAAHNRSAEIQISLGGRGIWNS